MENQLLISQGQASILLKQIRMDGVYLVVPSKGNLFTSMTPPVEVKTPQILSTKGPTFQISYTALGDGLDLPYIDDEDPQDRGNSGSRNLMTLPKFTFLVISRTFLDMSKLGNLVNSFGNKFN